MAGKGIKLLGMIVLFIVLLTLVGYSRVFSEVFRGVNAVRVESWLSYGGRVVVLCRSFYVLPDLGLVREYLRELGGLYNASVQLVRDSSGFGIVVQDSGSVMSLCRLDSVSEGPGGVGRVVLSGRIVLAVVGASLYWARGLLVLSPTGAQGEAVLGVSVDVFSEVLLKFIKVAVIVYAGLAALASLMARDVPGEEAERSLPRLIVEHRGFFVFVPFIFATTLVALLGVAVVFQSVTVYSMVATLYTVTLVPLFIAEMIIVIADFLVHLLTVQPSRYSALRKLRYALLMAILTFAIVVYVIKLLQSMMLSLVVNLQSLMYTLLWSALQEPLEGLLALVSSIIPLLIRFLSGREMESWGHRVPLIAYYIVVSFMLLVTFSMLLAYSAGELEWAIGSLPMTVLLAITSITVLHYWSTRELKETVVVVLVLTLFLAPTLLYLSSLESGRAPLIFIVSTFVMPLAFRIFFTAPSYLHKAGQT